MVQLKVYPTSPKVYSEALFLDLYETEPIKLNLSIEDITSADATSAYSKTFRVPATRHNNEFFKNAYQIDGVTYDITIKKPAEILVDGAEFKIGHVRLQQIFVNGEQDKIEYELLFLGETRDFSSIIADKTLCEIIMTDFDWSDYDLPVDYDDAQFYTGIPTGTQVVQSWCAPPNTTCGPGVGFADGNIIFPLIDHGNFYDDQGDPIGGVVDINDPQFGFTNQNKAIPVTRLKPMIRMKRIWDQIFEDSGYTYESEFFDSDRVKQMYISAFGNNETPEIEADQITTTLFTAQQQNLTQGAFDFLYLDDAIYNPGGYFSVGTQQNGSRFEATVSSTNQLYYIMSASAEVDAFIENSDYTSSPVYMRIRLINTSQSNAVLATGNYATGGNTSSFYFDSRSLAVGAIAGGDILKLDVQAEYGTDWDEVNNVYWDCTAAPGDYYMPRDLDCDYKQIDFIKDMLTAFRLVMQPAPNRPNHFIVEPWQDFIGSGTTYDWSHKLANEKDFVIEPLFNTQSATIEFTMSEDEDYINQFHFDNYKHPYGWLRFDSQNELLKGKRDIKLTGIAPTPINQIEQNVGGTHAEPTWIFPLIHKHDAEDTGLQHLPIKPKTRLLFYNGLQDILDGQNYWWLSDPDFSGGDLESNQWPLVSPYENWPVTQESLNLNFYNDTAYYLNPDPGAPYYQQGSTLYDEYWSRYIESLYNKFSRRITAYFILNNTDLQDLTFDDTIFVNGVYYRPEKIIDAQIGDKTAVKCQLITVKDVRPKWANELLTGFGAIGYPPPCFNGNGSIVVTTNGTPQFTWELDNGMTGTYNAPLGQAPYQFTINDVPPGDYSLLVTDSVFRTATLDVTVAASTANPLGFNIYSVVDPTVCEEPGCNGEATITVNGGTAPYTVYWGDGTSGGTTTSDILQVSYGWANQTIDPDPQGAQIVTTNPTYDPNDWYKGPNATYPYQSVYVTGNKTIQITVDGTAEFAAPVGGEIIPAAPTIAVVPIVNGVPTGVSQKNPITSNWPSSYQAGQFGFSLTYEFTTTQPLQALIPSLKFQSAEEVAVTFTNVSSDVSESLTNAYTRIDLCAGSHDFYVEDANGCTSGIGNIVLRCDEPITTRHTWAPIFYDAECSPSLGVTWEYTEDLVSYAPLTVATLANRNGCYMLLDQPAFAPTTTVLTTGENCFTCTSQPSEDFFILQECGNPSGPTLVAHPNGFRVTVGEAVKIGTDVCYEVISTTSQTPTADISEVFGDCLDCKLSGEAVVEFEGIDQDMWTYSPYPVDVGIIPDLATLYDPNGFYIKQGDIWGLNDPNQDQTFRIEITFDMTATNLDDHEWPIGTIEAGRWLSDSRDHYTSPDILTGWPTAVNDFTYRVTAVWNNINLYGQYSAQYNPMLYFYSVKLAGNPGYPGEQRRYTFTNIRFKAYFA